MPLGPSHTFPFAAREKVKQATDRSMFLSLQVSFTEAGRSCLPRGTFLLLPSAHCPLLSRGLNFWRLQALCVSAFYSTKDSRNYSWGTSQYSTRPSRLLLRLVLPQQCSCVACFLLRVSLRSSFRGPSIDSWPF